MNPEDARGVYLKTFGCQMNELDSAKMLSLLVAHGYRRVDDPRQASLIVINTCSVREKAAQKARSELGRLARFKRHRPELVIAYVGCVAQHEGGAALAREAGCDIVLGTGDLDQLPQLVQRVKRHGSRLALTDGLGRDPFAHVLHEPTGPSAFVAVMRGCDNYCSYCVVPFVRGPEVSRPRPQILEEVRHLVRGNAREIVLLGQNVNSYGKGLYSRLRFADLLRSVAAVPGVERVRFVTSHPKDLDSALIRAMAQVPQVCEAIHLPVQSGSDRVLRRMNRGYSTQRYEELIAELRESLPEVVLTSDLIVGFPGETDEDFERTCELIERVRFADFFSFIYSPRAPARAAKWEDDVPEPVKLQRLQRLHKLQRPITMDHHRALIGHRVEVLVSGTSKLDPAHLKGRTRGGQIVNFVPQEARVGELVNVLVCAAHANSLSGKQC
ncbi:MAG: tRNA (N6-isopentenyl adenosine(37)-C2)-methylthiotransferase MiaB [Candidatus Alcyoniella australis]|nr:tRNA (N6-isopentenyl adenosine(37)-C2)-methylthiotransferase MiaB [Candidatus Alcyoniella australis]